ncbi:spike base protein, RCAP_Rcc01079 family [Xanthobacter flavus]|uniref:spike base protein, RCAP_Rcc01079 family n=1 Tax=Xanthobacter flavus TaxID=281 RepID=UPI0037284DB4
MAYDPARDPMRGLAASLSSPTRLMSRVTPSDSDELSSYAKALWVFVPEEISGGVATVRITPVGADDAIRIDLRALPGLQPLPPCQVRRVWATGTSAGIDIYALFDR